MPGNRASAARERAFSVAHFRSRVRRQRECRGSAKLLGIVSEEIQARRFLASGRVQGVGYRMFVQDKAEEIGVSGYVRNRRDGAVEVFAMGTTKQLQELRSALAKGPTMSRVSSLDEKPDRLDSRYARDFTIELTI
jgi:acylphosphatase